MFHSSKIHLTFHGQLKFYFGESWNTHRGRTFWPLQH